MTNYAVKKFRAVAVHEAAHSVFCVLMDIPFVMVEIYLEVHPTPPGGATVGEVTFDRGWPNWLIPGTKEYDKRRAFNYCARDICMTLAGAMAAALHTGRMPREFRSEMDDEDCIQTIGETLNLSPAALRDWVAQLWIVILEILHIPAVWAAVQAVAEELFRQESLTWDEVCPMVDEAMSAYSEPALGSAFKPLARCARDIQRLSPRLARRAKQC
jgi:hypothetical protein